LCTRSRKWLRVHDLFCAEEIWFQSIRAIVKENTWSKGVRALGNQQCDEFVTNDSSRGPSPNLTAPKSCRIPPAAIHARFLDDQKIARDSKSTLGSSSFSVTKGKPWLGCCDLNSFTLINRRGVGSHEELFCRDSTRSALVLGAIAEQPISPASARQIADHNVRPTRPHRRGLPFGRGRHFHINRRPR
jgi:hypothetical protein